MHTIKHPLTYRSIAHLDDSEAQELAGRLGLSPETRRSKPREENLVVRNGVVRRLQSNQLNFTTQETKIIPDFVPIYQVENHLRKLSEEDRNRDASNPLRTTEPLSAQPIKRPSSPLDEFLNDSADSERLREDLCRVWYEKLALEGHAFVLQQENNRKDEVIGQLRIELEQRGAPHFLNQPPQAHNKSTSHHPSFSVPNQPSPNSTAHWNAVHPNRNFTIGQPRNF